MLKFPNDIDLPVCNECFQPLSVPPTIINYRRETICGRCYKFEEGIYMKSLYNIVAQSIFFDCTNVLNGCKKKLTYNTTMAHEVKCYSDKQECTFCSFSGNCHQILHHSIKTHKEKLLFEAIISFPLNTSTFEKQSLLIMNRNLFIIDIKIGLEFFNLSIKRASKLETAINQFAIKFFKCSSNEVYIDYFLLNANFDSHFKKAKNELIAIFGPELDLCFQILMDSITLEDKELEFQKKNLLLRQNEKQLLAMKQEFDAKCSAYNYQMATYNDAMEVIKVMSYNLFICNRCQKPNLKELFFCSKMHVFCEDCLRICRICTLCNTSRVITKFSNIENFKVVCDWAGCNQYIKLKNYPQHKNECTKRQYKCPLMNCNENCLSSSGLVSHWHVEIPRLHLGEIVHFDNYESGEIYWLIENNLYRICAEFNENIIHVLVEEINVLPNCLKFWCEGFVVDGWHELTATFFCGKFQINMANSFAANNYASCSKTESSDSEANDNLAKKITQIKICH